MIMMTNDAYDRYRLILIMIQALEVESALHKYVEQRAVTLGAGIEKHTVAGEEVLEALARGLKHPSPKVRLLCYEALGSKIATSNE